MVLVIASKYSAYYIVFSFCTVVYGVTTGFSILYCVLFLYSCVWSDYWVQYIILCSLSVQLCME